MRCRLTVSGRFRDVCMVEAFRSGSIVKKQTLRLSQSRRQGSVWEEVEGM